MGHILLKIRWVEYTVSKKGKEAKERFGEERRRKGESGPGREEGRKRKKREKKREKEREKEMRNWGEQKKWERKTDGQTGGSGSQS